MILNIENHTVKIDFEARTVEVSQVTPNMTETETLVQAVERVQQPTLDQWQPTEAEMVEMHREMNPEPSPVCPVTNCRNDAVVDPRGITLQCNDCHNAMYGGAGRIVAARKVRALETQPREPCRSSCCGTLNRRERDGSCAGCRGLTTDERESYRWSNLSLLDAVEGEE
tara:strand:+ start:143 stop:649 length:507 start_codon:yes stop_codon:yes gene_type:complete